MDFRLGREQGVPLANFWAALAGQDDIIGHYDFHLLYDGAIRPVRVDDLIHLSPDGAYRAATWLTATLMDAWAS